MDIQQAADILEIELIKIVDIPYIRKQYHKLALQYHPDKNENKEDSHEKFQKINEAYYYLKEMNEQQNVENNDVEQDQTDDQSYINMLKLFIQNILQCSDNKAIFEIIKDIVISCKQISLKLFEGLDKYVCIEVYEFISKYKVILHVSSETIEQVKQVILDKFKNDQIYILNPSINDLFENNVYKIHLTGETYLVPLWHNELYFDGSVGEIIVKCIPDLPDNISIDENNNLLVHLNVELNKEIFINPFITIYLGSHRFDIQVNSLSLKKTQNVILKRQGISQIIESDIYNVTNKADVIFCITLIL
jgi:hypothetical protein